MSDSPPDWHLLFQVGPYNLALPAARVRRLEPSAEWVPCDPHILQQACLLGLIRVEDRVVGVLDVARRIGVTRQGPGAVILLAATAQSAIEREIALGADRIAGTVRIRSTEWRPLRGSSTLPIRRWVTSAWRGRSRASYALDLEELIAGLDLSNLFWARVLLARETTPLE